MITPIPFHTEASRGALVDSCYKLCLVHRLLFQREDFKMAQRALARPVGFRYISTRTRPFSTVIDVNVDPRTQQITPPAGRRSVFEEAVRAAGPRTNWTKEEISEVYNTSLIELTYASVR